MLSVDCAQNALCDLNPSDVVIMAAAITRTTENTFQSFLKNIQMAETLISVLKQKPVAQLIYVSSIDVYGCLEKNFTRRDYKITEESGFHPDDFYGIGKVTVEFLLQSQLPQDKTVLTILRLPGVYGPGDKGLSLVGAMIHSAIEKGRILICGDGRDERDYLYVDDVYRIVGEIIKKKIKMIFHVASGNQYAIRQIAEHIQSLCEGKCSFEFTPINSHEEIRIKNMILDNSRMANLLPSLKLTELKQGIALYFENYNDERLAKMVHGYSGR